ncbi:M48 family metalloprotease [Luteibaculum oceani]|uniref:M48 family metalloprotease n=1 Tax=Luteibaculum oceani TaxID=1294296 RepID=A0A5C6VIC2_9FLAO|nr:M48 family metalloprotease [Luteibaculum oceani]TXC85083.1 M48 family metalloprotease [Luteibaculum oceani]
MKLKQSITLIFIALLTLGACKKKDGGSPGFNLFSIEDDKRFGAQMDSTILASPNEYPVLSKNAYPQAYSYLENMRDKLLNSGQVTYKDEFDWEVKIIRDDETLNAFCTPGGYIYIYTGLIKYLDAEYELAGVLGHEMAHADLRHSTSQLTQQYGISALLGIVLGNNPGLLAEISAKLLFLKFNRNDEAQADDFSVRYMCPTDYQADGAAEFFAKLIAEQQAGGQPEFLSTHPNPENRVEDIRAKRQELGCEGTATYDQEYAAFINSLP